MDVLVSTGTDPDPRWAADSTTGTVAFAAAGVTVALAATCWVLAVWQMKGMDMGVATRLGSLAFFVGVWVLMMAAMMLPGATPTVFRHAHASGGVRALPVFLGAYLVVWSLVGLAIYAFYRPHGTVAAGALVIAAGLYQIHAAQTALAGPLPGEHPVWFRVWLLLRRIEHRTDGDARGGGCHEPGVDVGHCCPRSRAKARTGEGSH